MPESDSTTGNGKKDSRTIIVNGTQIGLFPSNMITTTKYTLLTFIPKFLFSQFQNYTNCFFLLIILIQQIPGVSPVGRYTTMIPFVSMMLISAVRELIEDYKRYQQNKLINLKQVEVFSNGLWIKVFWQDLQVGNIIKVTEDEFFPADLVIIASSNNGGICYIETVNLDGETNLKIRRTLPQLLKLKIPKDLSNFTTTINCDPPNELIYQFHGLIQLNSEEQIPLHPNQLLLRDAILKNTSWIVGVVIYTGHETKVMKNSSQIPPVKRSTVSVIMNCHIIILFAIFLLITVLNCGFFFFWSKSVSDTAWYLHITDDEISKSYLIYSFFTFIALYSFMIPISLQVSQEIVRYFQVMFINNDLEMYCHETNTWASARTSDLNEDLGMVTYIFSDKTGTLTQNKLEFKCCVIDGVIYNNAPRFTQLTALLKNSSVSTNSQLYHFFVCLCLCNTVVPGVDPKTRKKTYFASSPDERALILATTKFGFVLDSRTRNHVRLLVNGGKLEFDILAQFEFTSARRRSSVIVQSPDKKIYLYIMGGDDMILNRISKKENPKNLDTTINALKKFGLYGYRTLCVGMVELELPVFQNWFNAYKKAQLAFSHRQKEDLLVKLANDVEKDVLLLGATAVEDKLQEDVPETISLLLQAGISIWMLTGDQFETAVNIGYSTKIIERKTKLIILVSSILDELILKIKHESKLLGKNFGKPDSNNNLGLIVNGNSLHYLLNSIYIDDFILLAMSCKSVICTRCTPLQKAKVVDYVRKKSNKVILAIGDGANDVAMIQKATIGIGISGFEGLQAAQSADYSIGQFKFLKKLLLVHGTWNYARICSLIYLCYYKNFVLAIIQFYYNISNGWSGQIIFDRYCIIFYNILFTSGPVLCMGIFEQVFSKNSLNNQPNLYSTNNWFNNRNFLFCLLNATWHGILLISLCLTILKTEIFWSNGHTGNYMMEGNTIFSVLILVLCGKFLIHSKHWTFFTAISISVSIFSWIILVIFLSFSYPTLPVGESMSNVFILMISSPFIILTILFVPIVLLLIDWIFVAVWRTFSNIESIQMHRNSNSKSSSQHIVLEEMPNCEYHIMYADP